MSFDIRPRVAIFASGTGTNFDAIMNNDNRKFDVVMLICDKPKAHVIGKAASFGTETVVLDPNTFPSKAEYETEIIKRLQRANVQWIVLAGYMRIVGVTLLIAYDEKNINVSPIFFSSYLSIVSFV